MTATILPLAEAQPEPVRHGTAEQLARLAHFRTLDLPEIDELDVVAGFLLGDVGDTVARQQLVERLREDCLQLWALLAEDWTEEDLDEVSDADWRRYDFATQQQEIDHRFSSTVARLVDDIEGTVWRERLLCAADRKAAQHRDRAITDSMRRHLAGSKLPGGVA